MTTKSDPGSDLHDDDSSRAGLFSSLGLDADAGEQSQMDDLLSEWRAGESEGSVSSNLYSDLLQRRMEETKGDRSIGGPDWSMSVKTGGSGRMSQTSPGMPLVLPDINDEIYGFRLLYELGSGSFAKVFLAKQGNLADREVVLKISAIEGTEPQTLAQLQHTHVVPIYSVHEDAQFGLRAVCMPYFGGASLNKVLKKVWAESALPVWGRSLLDALDSVAGPKPEVRSTQHAEALSRQALDADNVETAQTTRTILSGLPYVQAVAWIIARLAEGLQHSHERNVIHRDIKPSNILQSSEGQPLLLDFNVSQAIDCMSTEATVGGTIAYMSPEQLRSMRDRSAKSSALVNRRSDIYSLGLVMYEMLNGTTPFAEPVTNAGDSHRLDALIRQREQPVHSLKARSSLEIPWSLESIVRKSLAPNTADRYASAAQLAEDLNRFLQDLPLKFAPELSRVEQIRKWGRRHPRLTTACSVMLMAIVLMIPGAVALQFAHGDIAAKQNELNKSNASRRARLFHPSAHQALSLVKTTLADADSVSRNESLRHGIAAVREALDRYQVTQQTDWQTHIHWQLLDASERDEVAETIRELLLELASVHVLTEKADPTGAALTALNLLGIAADIRGLKPSRALELDRARYLSLLKRDPEAQQSRLAAEKIPVVTAHDLYMLAATHTRQGSYQEAVRLLTMSIEIAPRHYWSHFQRALCYQELGEQVLAVSDMGACVGLWPDSSWAHYNRGYLLNQQGKQHEAITAYNAAIKHDPKLQSAYYNRALIHLELQHFDSALVDLTKSQELGRNDVSLDAARAMALEGTGQHAEADLLFARVLEVTKKTSNSDTHRFSWTYAFAVAHRAPAISHRVFDDILRSNPKHPQALYGKGMLLMKEKRLREAVRLFDEALTAKTTFIEPLRYRAVALARLGQLQQAWADINVCVEREGTNPDTLYVAACVAAVVYRKLPDPEYKTSALSLLHSAIERGADRERARSDPDFSALRGDPDFHKLIGPESDQPGPTGPDSL